MLADSGQNCLVPSHRSAAKNDYLGVISMDQSDRQCRPTPHAAIDDFQRTSIACIGRIEQAMKIDCRRSICKSAFRKAFPFAANRIKQ